MKKITTATGDIAPEKLGFTLIHEHAIQSLLPMCRTMRPLYPDVTDDQLKLKPENLSFLKGGGWLLSEDVLDVDKDDHIDFMVHELEAFKTAGGNSLCECTVYGLRGRSVNDLKKMSAASGVNIICSTGFYIDGWWPETFIGCNESQLKEAMEDEINNGIEHTEIKPGFLKAAFSSLDDKGNINPAELTAFRACCRISAEIGLAIEVHIAAGTLKKHHLLFLAETAVRQFGVLPQKLLICHTDQLIQKNISIKKYIKNGPPEISLDIHRKLLDTGINISFDTFGNPCSQTSELPPIYRIDDYTRLRALHQLMEEGYTPQIMLGHDFTNRLCGTAYGSYGYTRVPGFVCPSLKQAGHTDDEILQLTVWNPMNFLAY